MKASPNILHVDYLDGLRALAVSLVVIRHVVLFGPTLATGIWLHVLDEGAHGVDLFFILSGFCLSYPTLIALKANGATRFNVAEFFAKRIVRIIPPYWIALGIIVLLGQLVINSGGAIGQTSISMPSVWQALRQLVFFDHTDLTNSSFWSLAVEFRWYLVFPIVLWLWISQRRAFWTVIAACVIAYQFTLAGGVDMGTLPCFMLGIAAAAVRVNGHPITRWAPFLLPVAIAVAVLLEPTRGIYWLGQDQFGWHIASFLFVLSVGALAPLRAIMAWLPLRVIGIASYSIYLMHQPLLGIFMGRMAWWYAVALMLVVCFAFWGLFERTVLLSKVRRPLIGVLAKPISNLLAFFGAPLEMHLHRTVQVEGGDAIGMKDPFVAAVPLTAADAPNLLPIL
ncbi:MAG TPA: acyltransferase [Candidatus Eremiobacteraceae bacterium]